MGEEDIEFYLDRAMAWTVQFGGAGFMPWNWNMFLANWRYSSSFVEFWDNELGCAVHENGGVPCVATPGFFLRGLCDLDAEP